MLTDWKLTDQLANISNQDLAAAMHFFCKVQFVIQHLILAKMCYCTISLFSQIYSYLPKYLKHPQTFTETICRRTQKNCKQIQYKQQLGLKQVYKSAKTLQDGAQTIRIRQNQRDFSKNGTPTPPKIPFHGFPFLYNPSCSFIFM